MVPLEKNARMREERLKNCSFMIFYTIGPVLETLEETLKKVGSCLKSGGRVLFDAGFFPYGSVNRNATYTKRSEVKARQEENDTFENHVTGETWLLKKLDRWT